MAKKNVAVRLTATYRDVSQKPPAYFHEFAFDTQQGPRSIVSSRAEALHRIYEELRRRGALLPSEQEAKALIASAQSDEGRRPTHTVTQVTGWCGDSYVLPWLTVGDANERPEFVTILDLAVQQTKRVDPLGNAPRLGAWKDGLKNACRASKIMTFALATAFAAPLLRWADISEGMVFLLFGRSGTGKTLASRTAMSVFGPAALADLATFDLTKRALEELCAAHNDRLLVIDEVGRAGDTPANREKLLAEIAYSVPSGRGRMRSRAVQGDLKDEVWRVLVLASSEESFHRAPNAKNSRKQGEAVRLIEIPVPGPDKGGIFDGKADDDVDWKGRAAGLSKEVEQTIARNHGVAIAHFIDAIIADLEEARKVLSDLASLFVGEKLKPRTAIEQRIAKKFGLTYAAGMLAIKHGCAPFTENGLERACKWTFDVSLRQMGLGRFWSPSGIAAHLLAESEKEYLFPTVEVGELVPEIIAPLVKGIKRTIGKRGILAIRSEGLADLLPEMGRSDEILRRLATTGALLSGDGASRTRQIQVKGWPGGERPRFHVFDLEVLRSLAARTVRSTAKR